MNNSTHITEPESCQYVSAFFTTVMAMISVAAFIGNLLVIVAVYKTPSLRTSVNYYYVNVAVSDFMCSIITWPLYLTDEVVTVTRIVIENPLATIACQYGLYDRMVSHSVSILSLVLIAMDRFIAIVFPLKAILLTRKLRVALICATWVFSLAWHIPDIYFARVIKVGSITACTFTWGGTGAIVYYMVGSVFFNITPIATAVVFYFRIMRILRNRLKPESMDRRLSDIENKRMKEQKNIMKIFISIVSALAACFTFFGLFVPLNAVFYDFFLKDKCKIAMGFCYFVSPFLSSMINPIILYSFSTNFRHAMLQACPFSLGCLGKRPSCFQIRRISSSVADSNPPELVSFRSRSSQIN